MIFGLLIFWFTLIPVITQLVHNEWYKIGASLTGNAEKAVNFAAYMTLPGTFLHELSHWLVAQFLLVRTIGFMDLMPRISGNMIIYGSVKWETNSSDPIRNSLIGAAPLLGGSLMLFIIGEGKLSLYQILVEIIQGHPETANRMLIETFSTPSAFFWLYLVYLAADALFPSTVDMGGWLEGFLYFSLFMMVLIIFGLMPTVIQTTQPALELAVTFLSASFLIALFVNLAMLVVLFVIRNIVSLIMWR